MRASLDEINFTDTGSGEQFKLTSMRTLDPGTERTAFVRIPFKHAAGELSIRTFDNVGNSGTATIAVTLATDVADPYTVTLEAPAPLTALNTGTPLVVKGDDTTRDFVNLPFFFPFFGSATSSVSVSSNGALYIPVAGFIAPHPNVGGDDGAAPTVANLDSLP